MVLTRDEALQSILWFESKLNNNPGLLRQIDYIAAQKLYVFCEIDVPMLVQFKAEEVVGVLT